MVGSTISQEPVVGQVITDRDWEEESYRLGCAAASAKPQRAEV
jgi:hypothetical protein